MDNLASEVGSREISHHVPTSPPPSKLKTFGFAIAIIGGIGGLAAGAAGYFHVGALSNMAQIDATIMMAARTGSTGRAEIIRSIDTQDGSVYGPEAWKIWNVEVLDAVPPTPRVDLSIKDKVLLYIPQRIRVHDKEQDFKLKALKEISGGSFRYFSESVEAQFGDSMAPGWVRIDKYVIPESRNKDYETQKKMVVERGCSMPSVLEAVVLNLMVFAFTGERLYGQEPWTYTRCTEKVDDQYPVDVGGFGSDGLSVNYHYFDFVNFGVACALRKF